MKCVRRGGRRAGRVGCGCVRAHTDLACGAQYGDTPLAYCQKYSKTASVAWFVSSTRARAGASQQ